MNDEPLETTVQQVKQMLDSEEEFFFLDCREPDEYETAHVKEANLIPMSEITGRLGDLEGYEDKSVMVMCHLGGRSLRVTHWLRQNGFAKAQSVAGGIDAWSQLIDPDVPTY